MNNKGTAIIITLIYIMIIAILCTSVLAFSAQHYMLMSNRVERATNLFYAEGGLYMGLVGKMDPIKIEATDPGTEVTLSLTGTELSSKRIY